jgi:hypothetical protein
MRNFDGTIILLSGVIGDSIMSIPCLRALHRIIQDPVLLVTSDDVITILRGEFSRWEFIPHEDARSIISCRCVIDTWCVSETKRWISRLACQQKIGIDFDDVDCVYDFCVKLEPFMSDTSACELYNPFARFFDPAVLLEKSPRLYKGVDKQARAKRIGLVPGCGMIQKRWPLKNFLKVERVLTDKGYEVVWYLGPKESDLCVLNEMQKRKLFISLPIGALMKSFDLNMVNISNDNSMMHLSAAMGFRTMGIFGPSLPGQWWQYELPSRYFQHPKAGSEQGILSSITTEYAFWPEPEEIISAI